MEIRKATLKDLRSIQELNLELCKKEFKEFDNTINTKFPIQKAGKDYFMKRITSSDCLSLVAIENKKIVGYIVGAIVESEDYRNIKKLAEAENMFVLKEYRNKEIGKKLMNSFIKWCISKKVKRIRVVISAKNVGSVNFHKKHKFEDHNIVLERRI